MRNLRVLEKREAAPDLRQRLCAAVRNLGAQGWCQGTCGNFSAVLSRDPLKLLVTRSRIDKRRLEVEDLIVVGPDGEPVPGSAGAASAETVLHCRIVALTGATSVLHIHSVPDTLLGAHFAGRGGFVLSGFEMLKGIAGVTSHEEEVFVPVLRNSQDMARLADEVAHVVTHRPGLYGFLLAGHGLYAWGDSVEQARRHVETLEFLFECVARRVPFEPFT